jgi:flagellar hook-basal body complex protein FliE
MRSSINNIGSSLNSSLLRSQMNAALGSSLSAPSVGKDVADASTISNQLNSSSTAGESFADTMKQYLSEVNQLQREASGQVEKLVTGQSDDLVGVMTAMEKSDLAFRTLLTIRSKLMDAYNELRNIQI